jgi:two-component system, NtrC family, sensor kinase
VKTAPARSSLRVQIVATVGIVIIALMSTVFLGVLLQARTYIIGQQVRNAESVARAFSIPVIDALILGDQIRSIAGDLLENHIRTFRDDVDGVLYISIVDEAGSVIAHSDPALYNTQVEDSATLRASRAAVPLSATYRAATGSWVLETVVPLQVGGKRWGAAFIGFDAEPTRRLVGRLFVLLFALTLSATVVTLGVLYFFIARFTGSLRDLMAEVDRIDFETDSPMTIRPPSNEIGYLVQHFELLKDRLVQSRNQLVSAQQQVYQAEKLASVGRLAAGVAHEVNNPLNGIRFCVYGIQNDPSNMPQTERYLGLINEGLQHIESVVQKLLGYARHQPASFVEASLNAELQRVLDLLEFQLRQKDVVLEAALDPDVPLVRVDPNLMQEMLMNLLLNSIDAIEQGGTIRVRTGSAADDHVFVSVTDNGSGIQPEHLQQIFEPFFTTKETGQGTGLGLAVTLGIVELHKGAIRVHSVPGKKTTFTVTLPRQGEA